MQPVAIPQVQFLYKVICPLFLRQVLFIRQRMEMASRLSSYSSLNFVRQRIHALRQSTVQHTIFELCLPSERGFGMCMDLADPVSSGKYSGFFVFTAPVAELNVVSFTVPLNRWTIVATATVVTPCSSSADCPAAGVFASRCRVVVEVSLLIVLRFCLGQRQADGWKILRLLFPVPRGRWCVCLLNGWFSSI